MLKQLQRKELDRWLARLAVDYRLQVPQQLADGTRLLAPYAPGELALSGPPPQRKPTSFFFPQMETLLNLMANGVVELPGPTEKPLALFGLDRADLAGIAFLDRFFSAHPADDAYLRNRNGALLIGLTGSAGVEQSFLPLSTGDCDIELIAIRGCWLALGHSVVGRSLLQDFPAGDAERLTALRKISAETTSRSDCLQQASQLLLEDRVPDGFWQEIADRCILCSGCNLACPTCSCFCLQDRQTAAGTERSRVWDSCQLDAFMREASGHNPLGTEALRTRRRIHHKLAADVLRWGELGCVACGRCDRACPTGIGIFAVAELIVKRFGKPKNE
ncbi:MAG TPA: 4Fe-4S dicluster domain-containing protein [Malonomonas sp.]